MRTFLVIVVILLLMIFGGWIVFRSSDGSAGVELRTDKIERDTSEAVEKSREWVDHAANEVDRSIDPEP